MFSLGTQGGNAQAGIKTSPFGAGQTSSSQGVKFPTFPPASNAGAPNFFSFGQAGKDQNSPQVPKAPAGPITFGTKPDADKAEKKEAPAPANMFANAS